MPNIEKHIRSDTSYYAYVDSIAAQKLLKKYRDSGFFSDRKLQKDSMYVKEATEAYIERNLEVYDYFDHDFILLTQEVNETLNAISDTYILSEQCNLTLGQIAVSIDNYVNLRYTMIKENGLIKIDQIENLGIIEKSP